MIDTCLCTLLTPTLHCLLTMCYNLLYFDDDNNSVSEPAMYILVLTHLWQLFMCVFNLLATIYWWTMHTPLILHTAADAWIWHHLGRVQHHWSYELHKVHFQGELWQHPNTLPERLLDKVYHMHPLYMCTCTCMHMQCVPLVHVFVRYMLKVPE